MGRRKHPLIIPIFIPHSGCPHQCAFCNQRAITSTTCSIPTSEQLCHTVNTFLEYTRRRPEKVQISFYGGTFLGLDQESIRTLLSEAGRFVKAGKVDSLRFSTRPDTINDNRLNWIADFPVSTIEIGVQSMDDSVLKRSLRGHTAEDTEKAVHLLKKRNYEIGLQMMVGLPGDDDQTLLMTARRIAGLNPDFVRIYPTVVLEHSLLARWYREGRYTPLSLEQCVTQVKTLYLYFHQKEITVIRMGLQASEDFERDARIAAGPYHPAFGHMVFSEIFLDMAKVLLNADGKSSLKADMSHKQLLIRVHPRSISRMRGLKNRNIRLLQKSYGFASIDVAPSADLGENEIDIHDTRMSIRSLPLLQAETAL